MNEEIIEKVRMFVEEECKKPISKYGMDALENHFKSVVFHVEKLSDEFGGDKEILIISAWLHDIGSVIYDRKNHHITGADIAEKKLNEFNYPLEKVKKVKHCILCHRGSQNIPPETIEAKILIEADALSAFDCLSGHFKAAFIYEGKNQLEAKKVVKEKWINKYKQLSEISKKLVKPKYEAAMLLLGD